MTYHDSVLRYHTKISVQWTSKYINCFLKLSYVPARFNGNADLLTFTKLAILARVIHKVCTVREGRKWGLAGQKVYWLKWGRGGTFSCKFMYAMNFFRSLKINRNKVKVGYYIAISPIQLQSTNSIPGLFLMLFRFNVFW